MELSASSSRFYPKHLTRAISDTTENYTFLQIAILQLVLICCDCDMLRENLSRISLEIAQEPS